MSPAPATTGSARRSNGNVSRTPAPETRSDLRPGAADGTRTASERRPRRLVRARPVGPLAMRAPTRARPRSPAPGTRTLLPAYPARGDQRLRLPLAVASSVVAVAPPAELTVKRPITRRPDPRIVIFTVPFAAGGMVIVREKRPRLSVETLT